MVKSTVCGPDRTKSAALKLDMTCRIDFMRLYKKTKKKPGKAVTIQNSSIGAAAMSATKWSCPVNTMG
jgi:hypothetical protein